MIDLHTHTNYSDGTWTVKELLNYAQKSQIEVLSITDHDTTKAYLELRENDYNNLFSGEIINGAELNVINNGIRIEVLIYDYDLDKITNWCENNYRREISKSEKTKKYQELLCIARTNGIIIDDVEYVPSNGWPIEAIYNGIKKYQTNEKIIGYKAWSDITHFLQCSTSDPTFPVSLDLSDVFPNIKDAATTVHNAGGKVFLAHPYKYSINNCDKLIKQLADNKLIDGIEVYHPSFSKEQIDYLYNYCIRNNLLMCGGSDCHGEKHKTRKIGVGYNNLNIDKSIIANWQTNTNN